MLPYLFKVSAPFLVFFSIQATREWPTAFRWMKAEQRAPKSANGRFFSDFVTNVFFALLLLPIQQICIVNNRVLFTGSLMCRRCDSPPLLLMQQDRGAVPEILCYCPLYFELDDGLAAIDLRVNVAAGRLKR